MIDCYKLAKAIIETEIKHGQWYVHEGQIYDAKNKGASLMELSEEAITDVIIRDIRSAGIWEAVVALIRYNSNDYDCSPIFEEVRDFEDVNCDKQADYDECPQCPGAEF